MLEATRRQLSEAGFENAIALAAIKALEDNGLSVGRDKVSVEAADGVATVTTRLPTLIQTDSFVLTVADDVFWTSLEDKMSGFTISQLGEAQMTRVAFDPPALPSALPPPAPPLSPALGGLTLSSEDVSAAAIAGIVVGSLACIALLGAAVYLARLKGRYDKASQNMLMEITRGDEATLERSEVGVPTSRSSLAPSAPQLQATSRASLAPSAPPLQAHFEQR